jgi:hypothetical protein
VGGRESTSDCLLTLVDDITAWLKSKGIAEYPKKITEIALGPKRKAIVSAGSVRLGEESFEEVLLEEISNIQRFLTRICVGARPGHLRLFLELRAGGNSALVAPMRLDVRCPQILRTFLERRSWSAGHTPLRTTPVQWRGADAAKRLLAVIGHADRNLPVVVLSQRDGRTLEPLLATELARDVSGLALVAEVDEAASWAMTRLRGQEWSCFNGAIRVYWPLHGKWDYPSRQPVWTWDRLVAQTGSEEGAASRIRDQLRRRLLELSTYTFDEPSTFISLRARAARARFEALEAAAAETGSYRELAEQYFEESAQLTKTVGELREDNGKLRDQVSGLSQALQFKPEPDEEEIAPESAGSIATLSEAVARARRELGTDLQFGDEVDTGMRELAPDAGPPAKIYEHLKTLAEMTTVRRTNGLGKNVLDWLRAKGVRASSESETVRNSPSEMAKRTWRVDGQSRRFEMHLKPNDATSPDRCVRIYFEYDSNAKRTMIGWIGRHPS